MLSTVGPYESQPLKEVDAAEGKVTIQPLDGVETLMVGGKPACYLDVGIQRRPVDVAANNGLVLVGVFCPGKRRMGDHHWRHGVPGQSLPSCDDRGTMRLAGDRLVFEAGGSNGF